MYSILSCSWMIDAASLDTSCTSGFADMSLLVARATDVDMDERIERKLNQELQLLKSFNCNGTINSLILGVDVRTMTRKRNLYPTVSLWRPINVDTPTEYAKVAGNEQNIVLGPANFSTTGVFDYPLDPPVQFQNGDMLGWFQPKESESVVRMYLVNQEGYTTKGQKISTTVPTVLDVNGMKEELSGTALPIYPVIPGDSLVALLLIDVVCGDNCSLCLM